MDAGGTAAQLVMCRGPNKGAAAADCQPLRDVALVLPRRRHQLIERPPADWRLATFPRRGILTWSTHARAAPHVILS
ncbi:hypothetical protein E2C01_086060 [Portunus trituberculatus]|uniref:Uncharacterized protein n=1 Tax=Portunus trituberculatus TaxID=210409 RepID=A0A5B7JCF0_PORTR|nr:hypothetical protein [Portunus trituberculatus]